MSPRRALALLALGALAALAAGPALAAGVAAAPAPFSIASAAFAEGAWIPRAHACEGAGASPPLAITGAPAGTHAVALLVNDPDVPAPLPVGARNFTHWTAWDAPVDADGATTFPAGGVPTGTIEGLNTAGSIGWTPPCPPPGSPPHRYVFTAYALDAPLGLATGARRSDFEAALAGHVLATATLTGCYMRLVPELPTCARVS